MLEEDGIEGPVLGEFHHQGRGALRVRVRFRVRARVRVRVRFRVIGL